MHEFACPSECIVGTMENKLLIYDLLYLTPTGHLKSMWGIKPHLNK